MKIKVLRPAYIDTDGRGCRMVYEGIVELPLTKCPKWGEEVKEAVAPESAEVVEEEAPRRGRPRKTVSDAEVL
jgi:hypothetical protein